MKFMNIADLKDPNDSSGRSYREINNATAHKYEIGLLVELNSGVRLFIANHRRDCDGTPLYSLTPVGQSDRDYPLNGLKWLHGYSEESMKLVDK